MKHLLVPTDFSGNARQALRYAVGLANHTGAKITLYHVYGSSVSVSERASAYERQRSEERIDVLLQEMQPRLEGGASLQGAVIQGNPVEAILNYAARQPADLIVMGTQGESGIKGFLVGSLTLELMRRTQQAVLAVPAQARCTPPRHMIFALDEHGISAPSILQPLREMAAAYGASISIYHQSRELTAAVPNLLVEAALDGLEARFHQDTSEEEVWNSILRHTLAEEGDLLCLIHRNRSFLERLFHRSVTREELSASPIPLLILHDRE